MRLFLEYYLIAVNNIFLAGHNKEDIEVLCDEVYMMDKGILTPLQ